ncbi:AsmA family protein [Polaromonas sp. AER18D-145]|uniref:AsmA family protein n=1 Tax=Polaromonas sp. AER18D-145 TaxID=1977060 RepID=UPI000BBCD973|nr:AsmA family protein [Polaromonas sp. AER18D-145]
MARIFRGVLWLALAAVLLLAGVALALHGWVGSDDFRQRVQQEASAALGLPVRVGGIDVALWPLPAVALSGIEVQSRPPLTLARLELRPGWAALLQGRLEVATLVLREVVLPQQAIDAILLSLQKKMQSALVSPGLQPKMALNLQPASAAAAGDETAVDRWLPRRALLQDVSWVSLKGSRTTVDAGMRLGADSLPEEASLKVTQGHLRGLNGSLRREEAGQWALRVEVGGGTVAGRLGMQRAPSAQGGQALVLQGQLETRGVEVSALTAPNRPLSGRLEASTTLKAAAATTAGLVDALQTQTRFTVKDAVLNGMDLVKAVQTVGLSRGGQTRLDTLAGQVQSQGRAAQLNNLVASSGALSATGNVAVSASQALSGRVSVSLGNTVGVPLVVGGTLAAPEVTLTRGALLGAALGTVVMPGVGTGAGMELGDRLGQGLGKLFGK